MFARCRRTSVLLLIAALPLFAADKKKPAAEPAAAAANPWDEPQPALEKLDLTMYNRIREEGLQHSHVMEYASALTDDIGPRLTGSPNMAKANAWTRDQFTAMGCTNAHLESWGEFGMGWQQLNTWVRMTAPDTALFIAQAAPWSPSTNGAVSGPAIFLDVKKAEDLDRFKGKVTGKIVLVGDMREVKPPDQPLFKRYDDKDLAKIANYPLTPESEFAQYMQEYMKRRDLNEKIAKFLVAEHALAVILPSRGGRGNPASGQGGTIFIDRGLGSEIYKRESAMQFPVVIAAIENYGRVYRLLQAQDRK